VGLSRRVFRRDACLPQRGKLRSGFGLAPRKTIVVAGPCPLGLQTPCSKHASPPTQERGNWMGNILLLYDSKEKDLVRDIYDLLKELNIDGISMISVSPDRGLSLEDKEGHYFDSAAGAIFVITPGSERFGSFFPSPSVSHEMGQAKQKFQKKPESVIYLVDQNCNLPAIDQQVYITFNRGDIRSVISAITQLIKDLKMAGLFRTAPIPTEVKTQSPKINIKEFSENIDEKKKQVLISISNIKNGSVSDFDFDKLLIADHNMKTQDMNFLKRDLLSLNVITQQWFQGLGTYWNLTDLGWEIIRLELEKKKKIDRAAMNALAKVLASKYGPILGK